MNMSVRATRVRAVSAPLLPTELGINQTKTIARKSEPATAWVPAFVLGFGAAVTVAWSGALLWLAGYLIGVW